MPFFQKNFWLGRFITLPSGSEANANPGNPSVTINPQNMNG
jgi:hypothetical protein